MKKIIFSLHINIPKDELDYQPPYSGETECKNQKTSRQFTKHAEWLTGRQFQYARSIKADYRLFENDSMWQEYKSLYQKKYPFLTTYNIVNFYKIHLMYILKEEYDQILYMDLDVVPVTEESFFDTWNLNNGIAILKNHSYVDLSHDTIAKTQARYEETGHNSSIRSPAAKWWNSLAVIEEFGGVVDKFNHPVFNTGIVGIDRKHLEQLDYFKDFDESLEVMSDMREESMYPSYIQDMFGWDNESLWGAKVNLNDVRVQWLDGEWHYFMDRMNFIPRKSKLVHVINKNFEFVRGWYEKNCL